MGRLTEHIDYCFLACYERQDDKIRKECPIYSNCYSRQMHEKLCHYEDLEEQGRLIELPCKVGDTVYYANHSTGEINPFIVNYFEMNKFSKELLLSYAGNKKDKQHWKVRTSIEHFEERFCKTKEEAEAKLEEIQKGE